MSNSTVHTPVLLHEVIQGLNIQKGDIVLDGTAGGGGHSMAIANMFGDKVRIIALDMDLEATKEVEVKLDSVNANADVRQVNYRYMDKVVSELDLPGVNRILLDLGLSSDQFERSGRGFSFKKNEPLLMTFSANPTSDDLTAAEIVNTWQEENLEAIIKGFGEERFAGRIARSIVKEREEKLIETTFDLVNIIDKAVPKFYKFRKIHPSTKTFQALRITVNDELGALKEGLTKGYDALLPGGRIAVISFHSLEDRIVKKFFKHKAAESGDLLINKKPITATPEEIQINPRSRSAKLRILEKQQHEHSNN